MLYKYRSTLIIFIGFITFFSFAFAGNKLTYSNPTVLMETSKGDIKIELFAEKAPITVENFLSYVSEGFYDGLIFHRVIKNFMIQGGGFNSGMKQKKGKPPIKNEARNGVSNKRGTIAMARTGIINSATSQFFINVANNKFLDHKNTTPQGFGYAVFGKVVEGMNVVNKIVNVSTGIYSGYRDVPLKPVVIKSVKVIKQAKDAE